MFFAFLSPVWAQGDALTGGLLTKCGSQTTVSGECRDISVFVVIGINLSKYLFGIIGALALGAFVYGGVVLILSQGNAEKVKTGTGAMMAAVIGLAVAFGGYLLVQFMGQAVGLQSSEFGLF